LRKKEEKKKRITKESHQVVEVGDVLLVSRPDQQRGDLLLVQGLVVAALVAGQLHPHDHLQSTRVCLCTEMIERNKKEEEEKGRRRGLVVAALVRGQLHPHDHLRVYNHKNI
jgi:uncharacterized protein YwbE